MLGKLMKHEWKSTYKVGCMMLFATIVITFFGWMAFQSPMWQNMESGRYRASILDALSIVTIIMYAFMLVGVMYGILIYLGVHFYRTMYTDQGYLTHTLPVTKHQILGSKILVSGLWMLFVTLAIFLSVVILISSLIAAIMPAGYSLSEAWSEIFSTLGVWSDWFKYELDFDIARTLCVLLFCALLSPFTMVTILFGAISVGQFFTKCRVLMAIVCYIGIMIVQSMLSSLLQNVVLWQSSLGSYMDISNVFNTLIGLLMAIGLYVVSWLVISKKLNME